MNQKDSHFYSGAKSNILQTDTKAVLRHLLGEEIVSRNERDTILSEKTEIDKNEELWLLLEKKDWKRIEPRVIQILRRTQNDHCADVLEGKEPKPLSAEKREILPNKWWPSELKLVNAFYERTCGDKLLPEKLLELLESSGRCRSTAICQTVTVSGFGGVGKTSTAKWFAQRFADKYDHIIWIDSDERSLMKSLKSLAKELKIKDSQEFSVSVVAQKSFRKLSEWKCLLVFDNAECYVGEHGIQDLLPDPKYNFHTIITSRNRDWGNANGLGDIPVFLLDVFDIAESIKFLSKYLTCHEEINYSLLKDLSICLGHLPLALQIAVAAINRRKMDVKKYIDRINDTNELLGIKFDDYSRTINQTMSISLDQIQKCEENEDLPYKILMIIGYLQNDGIPINFLGAIENVKSSQIEFAAEILEQYSLVTLKEYVNDYGDKPQQHLSMHRLLQQVIRHRTQNEAMSILQKILAVPGYLKHKYTPCIHAVQFEELSKEFKILQQYLFKKIELKDLYQSKKYNEAKQLAWIVLENHKDTDRHLICKYNYALCLRRTGNLTESLKMFTEIIEKIHLHMYSAGKELKILYLYGLIPTHYKELIWIECIEINMEIKSFSNAIEAFKEICQHVLWYYGPSLFCHMETLILMITTGCRLATELFKKNQISIAKCVISVTEGLMHTNVTTFDLWNTFYKGIIHLANENDEMNLYVHTRIYECQKHIKWGERYPEEFKTFGMEIVNETKTPKPEILNIIGKIRRLMYGKNDIIYKVIENEDIHCQITMEEIKNFELIGETHITNLDFKNDIFREINISSRLKTITLRNLQIFRFELVYALSHCQNLEWFTLDSVDIIGDCQDRLHLPNLKLFSYSTMKGNINRIDYRRLPLLNYKFFFKVYQPQGNNQWIDIFQMDHFEISDDYGHIVFMDKQQKFVFSLLSLEFLNGSQQFFNTLSMQNSVLLAPDKLTNLTNLELHDTMFYGRSVSDAMTYILQQPVNISNYFGSKLRVLKLFGYHFVVDLSYLKSVQILFLQQCQVIVRLHKICQQFSEIYLKHVTFFLGKIMLDRVHFNHIFGNFKNVKILELEGSNITIDLLELAAKSVKLRGVTIINCDKFNQSNFLMDKFLIIDVNLVNSDGTKVIETNLFYNIRAEELIIIFDSYANCHYEIDFTKLSKVTTKLVVHYVKVVNFNLETKLKLPKVISVDLKFEESVEFPNFLACRRLKLLKLAVDWFSNENNDMRSPDQQIGQIDLSTIPSCVSKLTLDNVYLTQDSKLKFPLDKMTLKNYFSQDIDELLSSVTSPSLIVVCTRFSSKFGSFRKNFDNHRVISLVVEKCKKVVIGDFEWNTTQFEEIDSYGLSKYGINKKFSTYFINYKTRDWKGLNLPHGYGMIRSVFNYDDFDDNDL